ncbi:PH domain-containing protein [Streptomyces sp. NPDC090306]|uniref:PH domain-containing protein n=1 Tax=Streptomyces sp. NPDC090306 TaxID=3365961 RepID=UPI0037F92B64
MTSPQSPSPAPQPPVPASKDRIYRSPAGMAGGFALLVIVGWLGIDGIVSGHGRTPWLALASLILLLPLIIAFTLRPAVYVNDDRLRVRNPLRSITLPWGAVTGLRSGYSNEVLTGEAATKYQLWAIPVSLRARKKAARKQARATAAVRPGGGRSRAPGLGLGFGSFGGGGLDTDSAPSRAESDKIMDELRQLHEQRGAEKSAQGEVTVRWAYEIMAPAVAGAVLLAILIAVG